MFIFLREREREGEKRRNQTRGEEPEEAMFLLKGKVWETHPTHV